MGPPSPFLFPALLQCARTTDSHSLLVASAKNLASAGLVSPLPGGAREEEEEEKAGRNGV